MKKAAKKFLLNLENGLREGSSFLRVMPDFIIIGAMKCGTTSLYNYLIQHPCIIAARKKEIHFFDKHYDKGIKWYRSNFPTVLKKKLVKSIKGHALTGEASPSYMANPFTAERIKKALPNAKLIFLLRNPAERAFSHYCHWVRHDKEKLSFEDAIAIEFRRLKEVEVYPQVNGQHKYITKGLYELQLQTWFELFTKNQLLFIHSEEFFRNPEFQLNRVFKFLGLPDYKLKEYKVFGLSKHKSTVLGGSAFLSEDVRKRLVEYYRPFNSNLYELLGEDLNWD
jgi:hypothetical protein